MKVRAITRQIQIKDIVFNLQDTKILFESSQCLGEEGGEERGRGACKLCWNFSYGFCHLLWENPAREKQERILKLTEKDLLKGTLLSVKLPMRPEKAPWARPLSHSFAYEMLFVSEAAVYFYLGGYSCQLSPDYWSVRSKWRSQSYHKDRSTTIEGDFQHSPSLPQNFNLWVNTAIYIFFFGCLVGHLKIISTLRRKLLRFIRNFLNPKSCCALPFPRKVHCSISTPIKFKSRAALSGRAAAQIGRAVAILLQSWAENRTLTLACCSHALPSPGFPLTPWHPAKHRIYLHNTALETGLC